MVKTKTAANTRYVYTDIYIYIYIYSVRDTPPATSYRTFPMSFFNAPDRGNKILVWRKEQASRGGRVDQFQNALGPGRKDGGGKLRPRDPV